MEIIQKGTSKIETPPSRRNETGRGQVCQSGGKERRQRHASVTGAAGRLSQLVTANNYYYDFSWQMKHARKENERIIKR